MKSLSTYLVHGYDKKEKGTVLAKICSVKKPQNTESWYLKVAVFFLKIHGLLICLIEYHLLHLTDDVATLSLC